MPHKSPAAFVILLMSFPSICRGAILDDDKCDLPHLIDEEGSSDVSEARAVDLKSELRQLRTALSGLVLVQDRQEIQEIIAEWRVLMDDASNHRGTSAYLMSDTAFSLKRHYLTSWTDEATLTVTSETGNPVNIPGRSALDTLWDDDGSFRNFQSNQRTINSIFAISVADDRCTAIARGSMNTFYDAYATENTVPGAPVVGMMTPFDVTYHFERTSCANIAAGGSPTSAQKQSEQYAAQSLWRINHVEMIADFFTTLAPAPNGYGWNNCGRLDTPETC